MRKNFSYKSAVHKLLRQWMLDNRVSEVCCVHHRNDTEETRKYNSEHYHLWGFNEDGSFEYGKYVVFMTHAEHSKYHGQGRHPSESSKLKNSLAHKGQPSGFKGHHHTMEAKRKNSEAHLGNKLSLGYRHTEDAKKKMSAVHKGAVSPFRGKCHTDEAKQKNREAHLGRVHSEETRKKISEGNRGKHSRPLSEETKLKLSLSHKGRAVPEELKQAAKERMKTILMHYHTYKESGGALSWQAFQQAFKDHSISLM